MEIVKQKKFANGTVYALRLADGKLIEVTNTFLPYYTKDAIGRKQNMLSSTDIGSRKERWMIGVSVMSGCPVRCKFCATGQMKGYRNLTVDEIVKQILWAVEQSGENPLYSKEFKINYTRMGEPFLNIDNIRAAIKIIDGYWPHTHHYVSTIGIKGSDFSWVKDNITLQLSLHSLDEEHRNWLIPFKSKLSIEELGRIRTKSDLKTTLNLTLVKTSDFDIEKIKVNFDPDHFFIKLSPINENEVSKENNLGKGVVEGINLV